MIDQRKRIFAVTLWSLDLLLAAASFLLAYHIRTWFEFEGHTVMEMEVYLWTLAIILPTWAILLPAFRVYSEPSHPITQQIAQLSKAIGLAWLVMAAILLFVNRDETNRLIVLITLGINYVLLVSYRLVLFRFKKYGGLDLRHVAVVGTGSVAADFAARIEKHREWGVKLIGVFEPGSIRAILESGGVDELIIVADRETLNDFTDTLLHCEELGVTTRVVLNFFPHSFSRIELNEFDGFPLLTFSTTPTNEVLLIVRRVMDIVLALVLAIIWLPVTLIIALLIKLTSPGPVFFKQDRCGLNGRLFTMYKLRSMVDNAEQLRFELETLNEMDGPVFKSSRDPRVTTIGKLIRRFSIDEFPQFYNVLRGDMSLVGPRPPLPQEVSKYERWQKRRLSMKPGITCLWQISGRNEVSFEDWMKLDLTYIDNWSLLLDLKILLKTVPVVLLGKGVK
jgi:exopolysaccharide biosynthesis polyprenyl glycosylphosphotransferase